ncbi:MAG: hypothetical protein JNM30_20240 [Rhodospirillales bacterium]|nr:hypothetical protein [Rhodospirillales bacterium]
MTTTAKRLCAAATILVLATGLGACSKCDMSGFLKSCGSTAPKAIALPL